MECPKCGHQMVEICLIDTCPHCYAEEQANQKYIPVNIKNLAVKQAELDAYYAPRPVHLVEMDSEPPTT